MFNDSSKIILKDVYFMHDRFHIIFYFYIIIIIYYYFFFLFFIYLFYYFYRPPPPPPTHTHTQNNPCAPVTKERNTPKS